MFVSAKKYRAAVETMEAWQKEAERLNRRLRDENIAYVNAAEEREELRRKLVEADETWAKSAAALHQALDASEQRHADLADKHNALLAKQPVRGERGRFVGKV